MSGLDRYISTVETAKHRIFVFIPAEILPDNMLVNIALDDAFFLGVLSSRFHVTWALAAGGRLGIGNDPRYTKTRCFDPFPFPDADDAQKATIRRLAEALDRHRADRLAEHDELTLTGLYNVLAKERAGEELTEADRRVHEQGLVTVLRELHDELDAAVAAAYGWPADLAEEEVLERLLLGRTGYVFETTWCRESGHRRCNSSRRRFLRLRRKRHDSGTQRPILRPAAQFLGLWSCYCSDVDRL